MQQQQHDNFAKQDRKIKRDNFLIPATLLQANRSLRATSCSVVLTPDLFSFPLKKSNIAFTAMPSSADGIGNGQANVQVSQYLRSGNEGNAHRYVLLQNSSSCEYHKFIVNTLKVETPCKSQNPP